MKDAQNFKDIFHFGHTACPIKGVLTKVFINKLKTFTFFDIFNVFDEHFLNQIILAKITLTS